MTTTSPMSSGCYLNHRETCSAFDRESFKNRAQNGKRLAHSESDDETIAKATAQLDGQCLKRLWMEPGTVVTHFEFDLGAVLTTFPCNDDDEPEEQWILFEPSGDVLSVRSDNRFCHGSGETPPHEEKWLPLLHIYDS